MQPWRVPNADERHGTTFIIVSGAGEQKGDMLATGEQKSHISDSRSTYFLFVPMVAQTAL